jgi:hypothetical protein
LSVCRANPRKLRGQSNWSGFLGTAAGADKYQTRCNSGRYIRLTSRHQLQPPQPQYRRILQCRTGNCHCKRGGCRHYRRPGMLLAFLAALDWQRKENRLAESGRNVDGLAERGRVVGGRVSLVSACTSPDRPIKTRHIGKTFNMLRPRNSSPGSRD